MTAGSLRSPLRAARFAAVISGFAATLAAQCPNGPVFTLPTTLPAFTQDGRCIVAGDLDGDGDPDLAAGGMPFTVRIWRNDGAAGFVAQPSLSAPGGANDIVLADFDQDGLADIATCGSQSSSPGVQAVIQVWFQVPAVGGAIAFEPPRILAIGPSPGTGLCTADLNGDGVLDFAMVNGGGAWTVLGQSQGGRPTRTWAAPVAWPQPESWWVDLDARDMDGDGALDLVLLNAGDGIPGGVRLLRGSIGPDGLPTAAYTPAGRIVVSSQCNALLVRDLDADGDQDVLVTTQLDLFLLDGLGGLGLALPQPLSLTFGRQPAAADFDGDGRIDVFVPRAVSSLVTTNTAVLRGTAAGLVAQGFNSDYGYPEAAAAVDFDLDGIVDVAIAKGMGTMTVMRGTCTNGAPAALQLQSPLGGEQWQVGSLVQLDWIASPITTPVDLDLSRDGGRTWEVLARGLTTRPFPWIVTPPATNRGLVRVRPVGLQTAASTSIAPFEIGGPGLAQARPLGAGCGAPAPRLDVAVPRFAGPVAVDVADAVAGAPVGVFASLPLPAPLPLGFGCQAWVDPLGAVLLLGGVVDAGGSLAGEVAVPPDAALLAVRFAVQAAVLGGGAAPGVQLTNAFDLLVGF